MPKIAVIIISRIALVIIIVFAVRYAIRALPETAPGSGYSGRARVIITFVLCGLYVLGTIYALYTIAILF